MTRPGIEPMSPGPLVNTIKILENTFSVLNFLNFAFLLIINSPLSRLLLTSSVFFYSIVFYGEIVINVNIKIIRIEKTLEKIQKFYYIKRKSRYIFCSFMNLLSNIIYHFLSFSICLGCPSCHPYLLHVDMSHNIFSSFLMK